MNKTLVIFITVLLWCVGFAIGHINGYQSTWQYEVNGWMSPSREMYKITVKPRIHPPLGLPTITLTVLEKKEDGFWYSNIGDKEYKFKEASEYEETAR